MSKVKSALDLLMLYASKTGAILFAILILPQFTKLLGAEKFGIVATIFSLQSLLLVLDLGMATIVGKEMASAGKSAADHASVWKTARLVLLFAYTILALPTLAVALLRPFALTPVQTLLTLILFWSLTTQNIGQAALLAGRHFFAAGTLQIVGTTIRGLATLLAMLWVRADLTIFLCAQASCAIAQEAATSWTCRRRLDPAIVDATVLRVRDCIKLAASGKALMLYGLAGAAALQFDKVIVASFASPAAMTPYYLATTLCLTPLSLLAGPVAQYFQPRVIYAITARDEEAIAAAMKPFVRMVVFVTILPTVLLWITRSQLIALWLGSSTHVQEVARYSSILLPGIALGALSYVPYVILIARQEFRFQSLASTLMTSVTLALTAIFAKAGSLLGVCWVYAGYHSASLFISWGRCLVLQRRDGTRYAGQAGGLMFKAFALSSIPALAIGATCFASLKTIP